MKKKIAVIAGVCLCGVIIYIGVATRQSTQSTAKTYEHFYNTDKGDKVNDSSSSMFDDSNDILSENPNSIIKIPLDLERTSITVLVNKEFNLPNDYVPSDLVVPDIPFDFEYFDEKKQLREVAARAIEELVHGASEEGIEITGVSGYRSYSRQKYLYERNLRTKGSDYTSKYSAKPSYSEHQTGLAIDVSTPSLNNDLKTSFATTKEGIWLAENCYKYGFILRYPEGKESITGYAYEPWHIRYVGVDLATYLTSNNLVLEEYFDYTPSITNEDVSYDSLIDEDSQAPTTPKPTKKPTPTPTPSASPTTEPTVTPTATEKPNKPEQTDKPTKPEQTDKPTKPEQTDKPTKPEQTDKPTKPEQTDKPTKPEQTDKPTKPEQTDNPTKPEQTEKPNKPVTTVNPSSTPVPTKPASTPSASETTPSSNE